MIDTPIPNIVPEYTGTRLGPLPLILPSCLPRILFLLIPSGILSLHIMDHDKKCESLRETERSEHQPSSIVHTPTEDGTQEESIGYCTSSTSIDSVPISSISIADAGAGTPVTCHEPTAPYPLPADEGELTRLTVQHQLITTHLDSRLILPPVSFTSGDEVLDSGTGTGIWMLDAAKKLPPSVAFTGMDISPRLFPKDAPSNIKFVQASTLSLPADWSDKYQLVSQRMLLGAFTRSEWPQVLSEFYRVVKPGGWIQLIEGTQHKAGPASKQQLKLIGALLEKRKLFFDVAYHLAEMVHEAGFINVVEVRRTAKLGKWAGDLGRLCKWNVVTGYRSMKVPVMKSDGLGIIHSEQEFDELMDAVDEELDTTEGASMEWVACYAQKP